MQHVVVGHPQHAITPVLEIRRSFRINSAAPDVAFAINFDNQPLGGTTEVDDVRTDHGLTPKLQIAELALAQQRPEESLRLRGFTAILSSACTHGWMDASALCVLFVGSLIFRHFTHPLTPSLKGGGMCGAACLAVGVSAFRR